MTVREDGLLLGVATPSSAASQPMLAWRAAHSAFKLKAQDGRQFSCRPATN